MSSYELVTFILSTLVEFQFSFKLKSIVFQTDNELRLSIHMSGQYPGVYQITKNPAEIQSIFSGNMVNIKKLRDPEGFI